MRADVPRLRKFELCKVLRRAFVYGCKAGEFRIIAGPGLAHQMDVVALDRELAVAGALGGLVVYFGRETKPGHRVLHWYAPEGSGAQGIIERWAKQHEDRKSHDCGSATVRDSGGSRPSFQPASFQPSNHHAHENGSAPW
jgi:hypothetical protein